MAIYSNSRYATAKITGLLINGQVRKYVHSRRVISLDDVGSKVTAVTFGSGDELDLVAYNQDLKEGMWWALADINSILFPLYDPTLVGNSQLTIGRSILVPKLTLAGKTTDTLQKA